MFVSVDRAGYQSSGPLLNICSIIQRMGTRECRRRVMCKSCSQMHLTKAAFAPDRKMSSLIRNVNCTICLLSFPIMFPIYLADEPFSSFSRPIHSFISIIMVNYSQYTAFMESRHPLVHIRTNSHKSIFIF